MIDKSIHAALTRWVFSLTSKVSDPQSNFNAEIAGLSRGEAQALLTVTLAYFNNLIQAVCMMKGANLDEELMEIMNELVSSIEGQVP